MNTGFAGVCRNRQSLQELREVERSLWQIVAKNLYDFAVPLGLAGISPLFHAIPAALAAFCDNFASMHFRLESAGAHK
jgi:hypothetical protein